MSPPSRLFANQRQEVLGRLHVPLAHGQKCHVRAQPALVGAVKNYSNHGQAALRNGTAPYTVNPWHNGSMAQREQDFHLIDCSGSCLRCDSLSGNTRGCSKCCGFALAHCNHQCAPKRSELGSKGYPSWLLTLESAFAGTSHWRSHSCQVQIDVRDKSRLHGRNNVGSGGSGTPASATARHSDIPSDRSTSPLYPVGEHYRALP